MILQSVTTWQRLFRAMFLVVILSAASVREVEAQSPSPSPLVVVTQLLTAHDAREWASCISFMNVSDQPVTAIQFHFTYWDAFDTPIAEFRGDRVGNFAPNVLIAGPERYSSIFVEGNVNQNAGGNCWSEGTLVGSLSRVTVDVLKVRFSNGKIVELPAGRPVFAEIYMAGNGTFVDPPSSLSCGIIRVPWAMVEKSHNRKMDECVKRWERTNGNLVGWPPAYVPPTPKPTQSSN